MATAEILALRVLAARLEHGETAPLAITAMPPATVPR
jgi:hypothetical protein